MTKEEIILNQIGSTYHSKSAIELSEFHLCMDEFAKQQAITFAQHMFQNVWKMNGMSPSPYLSHDQLYSRFIESKNK